MNNKKNSKILDIIEKYTFKIGTKDIWKISYKKILTLLVEVRELKYYRKDPQVFLRLNKDPRTKTIFVNYDHFFAKGIYVRCKRQIHYLHST